jgi:hypothetical protein
MPNFTCTWDILLFLFILFCLIVSFILMLLFLEGHGAATPESEGVRV